MAVQVFSRGDDRNAFCFHVVDPQGANATFRRDNGDTRGVKRNRVGKKEFRTSGQKNARGVRVFVVHQTACMPVMGKTHNSVTEIRGRGTIAPNAPGFFSGLYVILTNFRVNQGAPGSETRNKKPGPVRRQGNSLTFSVNFQDCFGTTGFRVKDVYPPRIPVQKKERGQFLRQLKESCNRPR